MEGSEVSFASASEVVRQRAEETTNARLAADAAAAKAAVAAAAKEAAVEASAKVMKPQRTAGWAILRQRSREQYAVSNRVAEAKKGSEEEAAQELSGPRSTLQWTPSWQAPSDRTPIAALPGLVHAPSMTADAFEDCEGLTALDYNQLLVERSDARAIGQLDCLIDDIDSESQSEDTLAPLISPSSFTGRPSPLRKSSPSRLRSSSLYMVQSAPAMGELRKADLNEGSLRVCTSEFQNKRLRRNTIKLTRSNATIGALEISGQNELIRRGRRQRGDISDTVASIFDGLPKGSAGVPYKELLDRWSDEIAPLLGLPDIMPQRTFKKVLKSLNPSKGDVTIEDFDRLADVCDTVNQAMQIGADYETAHEKDVEAFITWCVFTTIDDDGDGEVTFQEFWSHYRNAEPPDMVTSLGLYQKPRMGKAQSIFMEQAGAGSHSQVALDFAGFVAFTEALSSLNIRSTF